MDLPRRACARLCAGLVLGALLPAARAQTLKLNDTYRVIAQQPLQTDGRIEVIDFFWYGCPYCNELQPHLEKWRQNMPADVVLRRIPAIRRDAWVPHARIYYTLEALGELERLHLEVYRSYHKDELYMSQPDVMLDWARRNGIDRQRWSDAYNSVAVMRKIEQARRATADYDIQGTPSLVVDGLYLTSSGLTEKVTDVIPILDGLVKLAREKRRARPLSTASRPVFITGASSGIGAALARHYAARGSVLGLVGRRADALAALARECDATGSRVATYAADVRDAAAMQAAAHDFMARHGLPGIVVGNAGVSHGTLTDHPEDTQAFQDILDTNVVGLVKTFQPFIEPMRAARGGILAGIASVAGERGLPGAGAYSASKAAAIAYLESLRVELRASGVAVVTVQPGYIRTPMTDVNPYPMPFLLEADDAAARIARVIAARRRRAIVPWQMAIVGRLLRWMPDALYDRVFAAAPHKPRRNPA